MGDFGADEESCGGIRAGSHAGPATDARSGVHRKIRVLLFDGDRVAVRGAAGGNGDEATSGDDAVEGGAVDSEVLDDRESFGAPRLEVDFAAVLEVAHMKLADSGAFEAAMGLAVDHESAHAADAFAAIVVEGDRVLALGDEGLVN